MAEIFTPLPISNINGNGTTAATSINTNFTNISSLFQDVLSRQGIAPNTMLSNLDMNSNQILNLPSPATINSPARLVDVVSNPTITVPPVGTSGATVPLLNGNNTWSGTNAFGIITATNLNFANTTNTWSGTNTFTGTVNLPITAARIRGSTLNLYVNTATGNDSNNGSISFPFKTIGAAASYLSNNYDVQGVNVNVAAGTYNEQVQIETLNGGFLMDINYIGAGSGTTIIQAPSGLNCIFLKDFGVAEIRGFTLTGASGADFGISCGQFAICDLGSDIVFGSNFLGAHMSVSQNASLNILNNYTITGSAPYHIITSSGGLVGINSSVTATIPTALSFTSYLYASQGSKITIGSGYNASGAGAAGTTGTKFTYTSGGQIYSGGTDLNSFLPGNANGTYFYPTAWDIPNQVASIVNPLITIPSTIFASLPSAPVLGMLYVVTDSTVATWGSTIAGGGGNKVLAWYNGANHWTVAGA